MTTLNNGSLMSQDSLCRNFSDREKARNPVHSIKGDIQEKIVYTLFQYPQHKFFVTELSIATDSHRSTTGGHCLQLYEHKVVFREVLSGTENKINPTHVYFLNPAIKKEVEEFLFSKIKTNPEIAEINKDFLDNGFLDRETNTTNSTLNLETKEEPLPIQTNDYQDIGLVINTMASEIAALKERVARLEKEAEDRNSRIARLEEEAEDRNSRLDLSPAIRMLGIDR